MPGGQGDHIRPRVSRPGSRRVVIVGGGPAGSVAACVLGRTGEFDVTLIEQQRFPRDKVCGECLSAVGIGVARDLGLADALREAATPAVLRRGIFIAPDGARLGVDLPEPMWGVSRRVLDAFLIGHAAEFSRVMQPATVERIDARDSCLAVTYRDAGGRRHETSADYVIVADGKSALLGAGRPAPTRDFGIKSHWSGVDAPADAIELFGVSGHYGGLAPVERGRFNASFSVPAARLNASRGDLDGLFATILGENPELSRQMRPARRVGDWVASPLPRFGVRDDWPRGVIPVGNAAAAIEPIGGEGMGLAMRSAQLAAEALIASARSGRAVDVVALRSAYAALWRARAVMCRLAAQVVSRPSVAAPALDLLSCVPSLRRAAVRLIGK